MTLDVLARAQELVPDIRSKGDEIAASRRIPDGIMRLLSEAGLTQLLRPKRFGGANAPADLMYRVAQVLSRGDASLGWVYVVTNTHDLFMSFFPVNVQEEYWASKRPLSASSYNPTGKAVRASGGFTLSGIWSFCSGIDFCEWIVVGAIVGMLPSNPPEPDVRYFLLHESQFKIIDDWHVMGLCGTGSKSITVNEAFVPNERVVSEEQIGSNTTPGANAQDNPLRNAPGWSLFVFSIPAVAAGPVRSAYEDLRTEMRGRASRREPPFEMRKPAVQLALAEASVLIDSAELLYDRALTITVDKIKRDGTLSDALRIRNRRDLGYSILNVRRAAEIMMTLVGGRGIKEGATVQRALRDIYAFSAHPSTGWELPALSFGSVELGGEPTDLVY
jgi:3-hydroxy-9,10-secoandrosta-1,3,5(10)-triene-9,17-dione monooxygenase